MENTNFEEMGFSLCQQLRDKDYAGIAEQLGYALAFDKPVDLAIKKDFEDALQQSRCNLITAKCEVTVRLFPENDLELIRLIECSFKSSEFRGNVLAEIIQSKTGIYLEQISYVT